MPFGDMCLEFRFGDILLFDVGGVLERLLVAVDVDGLGNCRPVAWWKSSRVGEGLILFPWVPHASSMRWHSGPDALLCVAMLAGGMHRRWLPVCGAVWYWSSP